jgi:hypothetical protein
MRSRVVIFSVILTIFAFFLPAFAAESGFTTIKIVTPVANSIVMVDEAVVKGNANGEEFIAHVDPGEHYVRVLVEDGTQLLNESVYCNPGEETIVNVPPSDLIITGESSEIFESPFTSDDLGISVDQMQDAINGLDNGANSVSSEMTQMFESPFDPNNDRKPGDEDAKFGISLGVDNTNLQVALGSASQSNDIGDQADLSIFYNSAMDDGMFLDFSFSAVRTKGSFTDASKVKTEATAYPIMLNLKYRLADNIYCGAGVNYSYWSYSVADKDFTVSGAFGYQACLEFRTFSSEVGYIIKKGLITSDSGDTDFTSAGIYYMYKIFF